MMRDVVRQEMHRKECLHRRTNEELHSFSKKKVKEKKKKTFSQSGPGGK